MGPRSFNRGKIELGQQFIQRLIASMGPRSFNRGKAEYLGIDPGDKRRLQWGLGLSTEESPALYVHGRGGIALQWGLGLSTEERGRAYVRQRVIPTLQWGLGLSTEESCRR